MAPLDNKWSEYDGRPVRTRACDCRGCAETGEHRAPKNRELTEHYWFCLTHVRDYNKQWDYFAGMSPEEIEKQIRKATVWERPSWPMGGNWRAQEQSLRDHVMNEFFGDSESDIRQSPPHHATLPRAEREALEVLELNAPVTFATIKMQYRSLVKIYHPDANGGSLTAEEKFKNIHQAFTVLRHLYEGESAA